jgi:hypothetical protein
MSVASAALGIAATLAAGCGEEQTLTASEFVDRVNEQGVEMRLGGQLHSSEAKELYEMELARLTDLPPPTPGEHEEHGPGASGTLYVFDDVDGADDELAGCRASADLICYQAANIVALFDEGGIETQRLGVAIQRMAEE